MRKILIIDNYDSFTYNLVHYLEAPGHEVTVLRNDEIDIEDAALYDKIVLSPGPGIPSEAGQLLEIIRKYAPTKSVLGICLGQQAIAEAFGGSLINLNTVHHGVASTVNITSENEILFKGLPNQIEVGRYHSWSVSRNDFPEVLEVTSTDENGEIMSLRHRHLDVQAVQFHPESILTPEGRRIINNWLSY
jgi:anthranilate synthase component II